ncbi:putative aspartyl protease [Canna indica]|uniref:Aspartyl protease n=1 Tax=Canna indica TaxID=4628 RepID=A0AAQ3QI75_9LILI|nr:putative aspartyl protease [Canna indica]
MSKATKGYPSSSGLVISKNLTGGSSWHRSNKKRVQTPFLDIIFLSAGQSHRPKVVTLHIHLNWLACTTSYERRRCSSPSSASINHFLPKSSTSTRIVGCHNPRCLWIHPADLLKARCPSCNATSTTACPTYDLILWLRLQHRFTHPGDASII